MTEQSLTLLMIGCAAGGFIIGYLFGRITELDDPIEADRQAPDISCKPKSPPAPPPARDPRGVKSTSGFKRKLETEWLSPSPKKPPKRR